MADSWYYARDDERNGPFSGRQLRDLADAGSILRTDTVWKTGVERGVPAVRVEHLFPLVIAKELPLAPPPAPPVELVAIEPPLLASPEPVAVVSALESPPPMPSVDQPVRKRTASAGKGTIMMGQDGTQVKFKKKCTTCQQVDASTSTMKIVPGTMKAAFFCPKCRKRRDCELHGH